jgi:iron(III) transport system ATP-binding protein
MTVAENVAYGLTVRGTPGAEIRKRVAAILAMTRLEPFASRYPGELSGGQQQRVSLARALVVEPDILLLDEPLSNLDANLREEMRYEIRRLHDQFRYTTVYVTHDQTEAMTAADIIAVMNEGRVEQAGTPEQIYREPETEFVARFIGRTNIFKGTLREGVVDCGGGLVLRCANSARIQSGPASVSIRHHDVEISRARPPQTENVASGTVTRAVYLGGQRDYTVALPANATVRVLARESISIPEGESVWLRFPPDYCRVLTA